MIKSPILFLFLVAFASKSFGQDSIEVHFHVVEPVINPVLKYPSDWEVLKEVELHSSRASQTTSNTGMNVTVISKKELEQLPAQTVNEVLAWTSSIVFANAARWEFNRT